jgi:hypothetical protein
MRKLALITVSILGSLLAAAPVAANTAIRWTDTHDIDGTFTCGVVEDSTAYISGTAYFAADGTWIKDIIQFRYDASYADPSTGRVIAFKNRQVVEASPETLAFIGQGTFVRAPGAGAVLLDVGRLVIDPSDGSTVFASASVLTFEDPSVPDQVDAAVCSLF